MGIGSWSRNYREITDPEFNPNINEPATYPPNYGFSTPRKERVMIATEEEMIKAKVPLEHRDYCAHYFINFKKCARDNNGIISRYIDVCKHEKHDWHHCQYEDFVNRMKEYERERRLLQREKVKESKKDLAVERKRDALSG